MFFFTIILDLPSPPGPSQLTLPPRPFSNKKTNGGPNSKRPDKSASLLRTPWAASGVSGSSKLWSIVSKQTSQKAPSELNWKTPYSNKGLADSKSFLVLCCLTPPPSQTELYKEHSQDTTDKVAAARAEAQDFLDDQAKHSDEKVNISFSLTKLLPSQKHSLQSKLPPPDICSWVWAPNGPRKRSQCAEQCDGMSRRASGVQAQRSTDAATAHEGHVHAGAKPGPTKTILGLYMAPRNSFLMYLSHSYCLFDER